MVTYTLNHSHAELTCNVRGLISCKLINVTYLLYRPTFGLFSLAKTSRSLKTRISAHRNGIQNQDAKSNAAITFYWSGVANELFCCARMKTFVNMRRKIKEFWLDMLNYIKHV